MTAPNASAIARVEQKLDELAKGMTSILERLAGIEATHKAEASERATVSRYTQTALEDLSHRLDGVLLKSEYDTQHSALVDRVKAIEDRGRLYMVGLLFPIIATVVGAVIIAVILGH